jgi:hypothetical protein
MFKWRKNKMSNFENLLKLVEDECFGHESWIVFGREQHKGYWWVAGGDCSNWVLKPDDNNGKAFFGCPQKNSVGETLEKACVNFIEEHNLKSLL